MTSEKLKCCSEGDVVRDRLSELPDDIIIHILSCLPTLDAVRTVLLSRFGNLWTLVPSLTFRCREVLEKIFPDHDWKRNSGRWFYTFVSNVVMRHKGPVLDKFHLSLRDQQEDHRDHSYLIHKNRRRKFSGDIRKTLKFALNKQAKEIKFCDINDTCFSFSDVPKFASQSLVTLELSHCTFGRKFEVNLGSLKKLSLRYVRMRGEAFRRFLSGCPSLQELSIVEPNGTPTLIFSAPNIRKLCLDLREWRGGYNTFLLDFPNLKSLELDICRIPDVHDVSSLQNVYLKGFFYDNMNNVFGHNKLKVFLEKFVDAEVFQIARSGSEAFLHVIDDLCPSQIRWKRVVFELKVFCQSCVSGFCQLMSSSKHLEELIIYTTGDITRRSVSNSSSLFPCQGFQASTDLCLRLMPKLKTVTLHGYVKPWERQLELVKFLLESATALDKLVIVPNKHQLTEAEEFEFAKCVSSFERSSPSAKVIFTS